MKSYKARLVSMSIAAVVAGLISITIVKAENQQTANTLQEYALISDTLEGYAAKCDLATGVTVPDFDCDAGTEVPITNFVNGNCDRPNRLNQVCDPGSRFQVLSNSPDAYVVAHCRKQGLAAGQYGDIAVIQYNQNNGAACFYQALGNLNGQVKAPSKGQAAWPWISPAGTASIRCGGCHDNGPLIRSPYITQNMGNNTLPGAGDFSFNKNEPYYWVGADFENWRANKVEVGGNLCNSCHRMGVSNISGGVSGTALDFGIRATAPSEPHKNPHSSASPIWMTPGQVFFSQTNADFARAIHDCAKASVEGGALPANCTTTPFAWAFLADLFLEQTASPDPVLAGGNLTYTLKVTNNQVSGNGPIDIIPASSTSPGVTLTNTLHAGVTFISAMPSQGTCAEAGGIVTCQLGRLNSGANATVMIVVMTDPSTADGTIITNKADVISIVPDPQLGDNTSQVNTTVVVPADLAITKSAMVDPVTAGTDETYQITITNNGPNDAQNIALTDDTPANTTFVSFTGDSAWGCLTPAIGDVGTVTCTTAALANGASATFTMVVHVNPSTPDGSTLSNTASVSASTTDSDLSNNINTIATGVSAQADLRITLTRTSKVVIAGIDETYDLRVRNKGPSDAQNVALTGAVPANTTFVSFVQDTGPAFACTTPLVGGTGNINCTLATLAMDELATFRLVVLVDPIDVSSISNTASVVSSTTDPKPGNSSDNANVTVSIRNYKQEILDDLTKLSDSISNAEDSNKLDNTIQRLSNSLDPGPWVNDNTLVAKSGKKVFNQEKAAVVKLNELINHNNSGIDSVLLQEFIDRLVATDRALADIAIHQAISVGGNANQIVIAQNQFSNGDDSVNNGQYAMAVARYQSAWQHAQQAMNQ